MQSGHIQQLADVLLPLIAIELLRLKLLTDVCQLFIDTLFLKVPGSCISEVGNELHQAAHGAHIGGLCIAGSAPRPICDLALCAAPHSPSFVLAKHGVRRL